MRYSLRTLLILITLAALYFGWVAFARQRAKFHRGKAADLVAAIASSGVGMSQRELQMWTELLASDRAQTYGNPALGGLVSTSLTRHHWETAIDHEALANAYDRVGWQPWRPLFIKRAHQEKASMFRFTIRDMLWLTLVVGLAVAWCIHYRSQATLRRERDSALRRFTNLTNFLEGRGLDVFVDDQRQHVVMSRKDGQSLTAVADQIVQPQP
jgi:hypothetical protein